MRACCPASGTLQGVLLLSYPAASPAGLCAVQEACSLAKRCLRRARQRGASRHSAARIAATVLTRAAVDRGSRDNVTVVVVDLSRSVTVNPKPLHSRPALLWQHACSVLKRLPAVQHVCLQQHRWKCW
jgi:outer membrane receptor for monomeric catechols